MGDLYQPYSLLILDNHVSGDILEQAVTDDDLENSWIVCQ
jgi:hypothetical protein